MLTVLITQIIKELITYFKDKNHKWKEKYIIFENLNTILESVDTIAIIGATSTSITASITGIGLKFLPISAEIACTLSLGNKVLHKLIINKYNRYKKQREKIQQTFESFDIQYNNYLQDNKIDKNELGSLSNIFTEYLD